MRLVGDFLPLTHVVTVLQDPWNGFAWNATELGIVAGIMVGAGLLAIRVFRWERSAEPRELPVAEAVREVIVHEPDGFRHTAHTIRAARISEACMRRVERRRLGNAFLAVGHRFSVPGNHRLHRHDAARIGGPVRRMGDAEGGDCWKPGLDQLPHVRSYTVGRELHSGAARVS